MCLRTLNPEVPPEVVWMPDALSGYHPALCRLPSGTVDILHVRPQSGRLAQQLEIRHETICGVLKMGDPQNHGFQFQY